MKKTSGKLIVIEGGDGAGKATQCELLIEALQELGVKVTYFDYPRYDNSFFGALTGRALKGEYGDFRHMHPHLSSLPYMLDRLTSLGDLSVALKKGFAICNRYTTSSMAFQATKFKGKAREEVAEFIEHAEHDELGMPRPHLVLYLNVDPTFSFEMIAKKDKRNYLDRRKNARDQHEKDRRYQKDVVETYLWLAKTRPGWRVIKCVEDGKLLPREQIHKRIMEEIKRI
jgi:dTMP kinase